MKTKKTFLLVLLFILGGKIGLAQIEITGKVIDANDGKPVEGATVVLKDHSAGAITDIDGIYKLRVSGLPATVIISFAGYTEKEVVFSVRNPKPVRLEQSADVLQEAIVKAERVSQKEKEEPLTVESIGIKEIKEAPAASFYESLGNLKGVDITSASLGFRVINTRGFNSTSPVRSLQLIDGVDNQSPGLNFSLGNFLGASDLDVKRVELIAGASSAYFGPNAFNGVINMETKDPFIHKGLDVQMKGGERQLREISFRFADVFTNKKGREVFAYKISFLYFEAIDWKATNYDPTSSSQTGIENPGGYDAINRYGDEDPELNHNYSDFNGQFEYPGLRNFYRSGYRESDLVKYNTDNIKLNLAGHYKFKDSSTLIYAYNRGGGSTVYQGDNRYRLEDIKFWQNRIEYRKEGKFFIRAYSTQEDAGKSYDIVSTGVLLNEASSNDLDWNTNYKSSWNAYFEPQVRSLPGFPEYLFGMDTNVWLDTLDRFLATYHDSIVKYHKENRYFADFRTGSIPKYEPGTQRYDSLFDQITSTKFNEGGTLFFDRSALYHVHGEYKFNLFNLDVTAGANGRLFKPNSGGTIFIDTGNATITNREFGLYTGVESNLINKRLKLNVTGRLDKNQNYDYLISPAISTVYKLTSEHIVRLSASSAIRNPTLADQYLFYNVGRAILLGNLNGYDSLITISSFNKYRNHLNLSHIEYFDIDPIKPEKVKSLEIGYKGTMLDKSIYVDGSYYYSWYTDFIGYVIALDMDFIGKYPQNIQAYRVSTNAKNRVTTQGLSIAVSYYHKKLAYTGNYSWNVLNKEGTDDPIIPAFNTPKNKFNIGISGRKIKLPFDKKESFGFGFNYKWVDGFRFEGSPQFTGFVHRYDMVDGQINYSIDKIHCIVKVGCSNLFGILPLFENEGLEKALDNKNYQVYGGPSIGRMGYVSVLFELHKLSITKKKENML